MVRPTTDDCNVVTNFTLIFAWNFQQYYFAAAAILLFYYNCCDVAVNVNVRIVNEMYVLCVCVRKWNVSTIHVHRASFARNIKTATTSDGIVKRLYCNSIRLSSIHIGIRYTYRSRMVFVRGKKKIYDEIKSDEIELKALENSWCKQHLPNLWRLLLRGFSRR